LWRKFNKNGKKIECSNEKRMKKHTLTGVYVDNAFFFRILQIAFCDCENDGHDCGSVFVFFILYSDIGKRIMPLLILGDF